MYKISFTGILLWVSILFLYSCTRENRFFTFPVQSIMPKTSNEVLVPELVSENPFNAEYFELYNRQLISYERKGSSFISVNDLYTGELLHSFCPKGRGPEESSFLMPTYSLQKDCLNLFDPIKCIYYALDLRQSILSDKTCFRTKVKLDGQDPWSLPITSCFIVGKDSLLVMNTKQMLAEEEMVEPPVYQLFSTETGDLIKTIEPYKMLSIKGHDPIFNSKVFYNSHECLCKGGIVCCAMAHMPQVNFVNPGSSKVQGLRIKGMPRFRPRHSFAHFLDIESSKECLFSLYGGASYEDLEQTPSALIVIAQNGRHSKWYKLNCPYRSIAIQEDTLYLSDYQDLIYSLPISQLSVL